MYDLTTSTHLKSNFQPKIITTRIHTINTRISFEKNINYVFNHLNFDKHFSFFFLSKRYVQNNKTIFKKIMQSIHKTITDYLFCIKRGF